MKLPILSWNVVSNFDLSVQLGWTEGWIPRKAYFGSRISIVYELLGFYTRQVAEREETRWDLREFLHLGANRVKWRYFVQAMKFRWKKLAHKLAWRLLISLRHWRLSTSLFGTKANGKNSLFDPANSGICTISLEFLPSCTCECGRVFSLTNIDTVWKEKEEALKKEVRGEFVPKLCCLVCLPELSIVLISTWFGTCLVVPQCADPTAMYVHPCRAERLHWTPFIIDRKKGV